MYVAWLTGRDTFHLAGYRIGAGGMQGTLFSRTMPGEVVSLAGGQVLVRDPGVSLYLVDPVTGKATRIRDGLDERLGNLLLRPRPPAPGRDHIRQAPAKVTTGPARRRGTSWRSRNGER